MVKKNSWRPFLIADYFSGKEFSLNLSHILKGLSVRNTAVKNQGGCEWDVFDSFSLESVKTAFSRIHCAHTNLDSKDPLFSSSWGSGSFC